MAEISDDVYMNYEPVDYTQEEFLRLQDFFATNNNSYYFDEQQMGGYMKDINKIYNNNRTWQNFEYLISKRKLKIVKKQQAGWFFGNDSSVGDDLLYTFDRYENRLKQQFGSESFSRNAIARRERERNQDIQRYEKWKNDESLSDFDRLLDQHIAFLPPNFTIVENFKKKFPKITNIYKRFIMEEDDLQLDKLLENLLFQEKKTESETYDLLIEEARRKYNFEKNQYNENVRNYSQLSTGMKEKTQEMGKNLDKFLLNLKPLIQEYDATKRARNENFQQQISRNEQIEAEKTKKKIADKKQLQLANEQIEDLEYKIKDAESKYSMNKAKLRKLDFKIKKIEELKSQKSLLEEKLKKKNLKQSLREKLVKQKARFDKIDEIYNSLRDQQQKLYSQLMDYRSFEYERQIRERELNTLRELNETSIRTKNANLRSLELEKKRQEIRILEEERYAQKQREEEELKQAKIVFLKEKKLANKRIDQLKWESKSKNIKLENLKKLNSDLENQKQNLKEILRQKQSSLRDKQEKIERQKILNLESKKREAESQQLFTDSLKRDVDELQMEKQILSEISDENKKILNNTKKEISNRQQEIEKTISLNMETAKQNASEIYAKIAQRKLDVFQTLSEVKNQAALKTDVENTLEDLKDSILRKEAVENLLSDTIDNITNKEISEVEDYNEYLESEIDFKKKLSDTHLTQKQVLEILTEEKKSYLQFLEETKSTYLTQMLNAKRDIIEKNIKIVLIEGKENLSYVTSGMKSEIENLEFRKEISERKKDLFKFQADNAKKELNLRKQEIELLKNIRLKVIETQRINARSEARIAIQDMVKAAEKTERDSEVREKLDEILDDVESKEISESTKRTLYSLIDKISETEIHDSAKKTLNVILDKIELHDNIDESRKALATILDKIEDKEIQNDVETKIDEILDDIEFDDYDFLEDDDLDNLLKSVRKHISGEEKIEKFLPKIREEDTKLKMDENIELQERNPPPENNADDVAETSFDEFSDYNFFINTIEDPVLKEKTRTFLGNIDGFEKENEKIEKSKNAYKSAINSALWEDQLDTDYWDGNIILDEQAKFKYEQKVNNINTALTDYDIHIDPTDLRLREFLDIKLVETFSDKRQEINGYKFNGEKIISRNISRNFFFNYLKKPSSCQKFIDELKEIINKTAKSQITSESYFEGKAVKDCAMEHIGELREEQSYMVDSARNAKEMRDALRNSNEMDQEIKKVKKNLPFKMRMKIFKRTLSWRFTKLLRLLWKHKGKVAGITFALFSTAIGIALNQLGVIAVVHNLKKAARSVHQYANDVHDMGKRIIQNVQALYGVPGKIMGWGLMLFGIFLRMVYFTTRMSGTASSGLIFAILGGVIEISLIFSGNIETINEKASEVLEETGNAIEDVGIRAQKTIAKNMPRWYYDKPPEERTILQHVEAAAANVTFKLAKGTQYTGKKVQEAGEIMSHTLFYMQALLVIMFALIILSFVRNNLL